MDELDAAWRELLDELDRQAPATRAAIRAPGGSTRHDEARLPVRLNEELRAWFGLHGGRDPWLDGQIFPFNTAIDLARAVEDTLMVRGIWQAGPLLDEAVLRQLTRRRAGTVVRTWLDPYVAISHDGMGGRLFVDLRPGRLHGCVRFWDKVDADDRDVLAPSITALLTDVTRGIRTGRAVGGWTPHVVDGIIDRQPEGLPRRAGGPEPRPGHDEPCPPERV